MFPLNKRAFKSVYVTYSEKNSWYTSDLEYRNIILPFKDILTLRQSFLQLSRKLR